MMERAPSRTENRRHVEACLFIENVGQPNSDWNGGLAGAGGPQGGAAPHARDPGKGEQVKEV